MKNKGFILLGLLLILAAAVYALPFTEGFDGAVFPPTGWTANGVTRVNSTVTTPYTAPYCVEFDASADNLITPLLVSPQSMVFNHKKGTGNYRFYLQHSTSVTGPWTDFLLTDFVPPLAANEWPIWAANTWTNNGSPVTVNLSNYSNIYIRWTPQATPPPAKIFYLDNAIYQEEEECVAPTIQASGITFPYAGLNSLTINWVRGNGAYCVAFLHEGAGVPTNPIDGTTYVASTDWLSKGTQLGTSGYYCIYNGIGTSVTVTNLLSLTNYYVAIYEYNCDGINSKYLVPPATNNTPTTPVELSSFTAVLSQEYFVELHWTTQSETEAVGYEVYRNSLPNMTDAFKVNPYMIPATNTTMETDYNFTDMEATPGTWYYWLESKNLSGSSDFFGPISITILDGTGSATVPEATSLSKIFPNPFNPGGSYLSGNYELAKSENVLVAIYNIKGSKVRTLATGTKNAGAYPISWDGRDDNGKMCTTGVYYIILKTSDYITTKKIVMIK